MKKLSFFTRVSLSLFALANAPVVMAQATEDEQVWLTYLANGLFDKKSPYGWQFEVQERLKDEFSNQDRWFVRGGLTWQTTPKLQLSASLLRQTVRRTRGSLDENRLVLQGLYAEQWQNLRLQSRTRAELRDFEDDPETANRFRQQFRLSHPIPGYQSNLYASVEYLWNLDRTARQTTEGYAENRTQVGVTFPVSKTVTLDTGYMRQRTRNTPTPVDNDNLIIQVVQRF